MQHKYWFLSTSFHCKQTMAIFQCFCFYGDYCKQTR